MPEGDTVRRLTDRLHRRLAGRTITRSDLRVPQHATADLSGARIESWSPYGKHILCRLDNGLTLHTHLKMDGSWTVLSPGKQLPVALRQNIRVVLRIDDGATAVGVSLPIVELLRTADEHTVLGHLGPDILAPDFDEAEAVRRLAADPARPAVSALLDQRNVAGIGNLWAVETLFLRGVQPWTAIGDVDVPAATRLAKRMMTYALTHPAQATTGDTRRGRSHWVYGRAGEPCLRCGTRVAFRAATGHSYERETWWCPCCQPAVAEPATVQVRRA